MAIRGWGAGVTGTDTNKGLGLVNLAATNLTEAASVFGNWGPAVAPGADSQSSGLWEGLCEVKYAMPALSTLLALAVFASITIPQIILSGSGFKAALPWRMGEAI